MPAWAEEELLELSLTAQGPGWGMLSPVSLPEGQREQSCPSLPLCSCAGSWGSIEGLALQPWELWSRSTEHFLPGCRGWHSSFHSPAGVWKTCDHTDRESRTWAKSLLTSLTGSPCTLGEMLWCSDVFQRILF